MKNYITEKPVVFDYCMFGFDYRKRTSIWSNKKKLVDCKCDRSHLVDGRHKMTAIGTSKTQAGQGGGSTVSTGLRETVTKRNATGVFQILFIETVRAPPPRATETAVT